MLDHELNQDRLNSTEGRLVRRGTDQIAQLQQAYGQDRQKYARRPLPSHRWVMRAIEQCRTPTLAGQAYLCPQCHQIQYSYHSCRNRHCPKCQNDKVQDWLGQQQNFLLPVNH